MLIKGPIETILFSVFVAFLGGGWCVFLLSWREAYIGASETQLHPKSPNTPQSLSK